MFFCTQLTKFTILNWLVQICNFYIMMWNWFFYRSLQFLARPMKLMICLSPFDNFFYAWSTKFMIFPCPINEMCDFSKPQCKICYFSAPDNKILDFPAANQWNLQFLVDWQNFPLAYWRNSQFFLVTYEKNCNFFQL